MRRAFIIVIILVVMLAILAGVGGMVWLDRAANHVVVDKDTEMTVPAGMTMRGLATRLVNEGLLDEPWSLRIWARRLGLSTALRAGEYRVPAGSSMTDLLVLLTSGKVIDYPVTIIEGWTFRRMRDALARAPKLKQVTQDMDDTALMKAVSGKVLHPEGCFFPDTYHYTAGTTDLDIFKRAYERMSHVLTMQWDNRAEGLPLKTPYEALILASIVEKETGVPEERALIAGVFINRLRKGMRLQTDPTVIYGMGENYHGNIRRKDLLKDTPYNTYTRAGLPPTPIALPGGDAIHAVVHPADTKALYFVARGDGSHEFSNTLKAHNAAVIKYQLNGKRRKFSSHMGVDGKVTAKSKDAKP